MLCCRSDICHLEVADGEDDDRIHVIDALLELLKERPLGTDGRPFLSCFALTHPDTDHVKGFQELLDTVNIGELWLTPRVFRDHSDDSLNDDAKDFHKEAMRRVKATIKAGGLPASGDRVRVIGWDALLDEDDFKGFPRDLLTIPGTEITGFDGQNLSEVFRAFVHTPFAADSEGERNDTSLGMQVTLTGSRRTIRVMLLGDLCAPTVHRIFCDATPVAENLAWDIFVPPHHCSKGALFVAGESGEPELDEELVECLNEHAADGAYVVASCDEFSDSDETGDQPPHRMAPRYIRGNRLGGTFPRHERAALRRRPRADRVQRRRRRRAGTLTWWGPPLGAGHCRGRRGRRQWRKGDPQRRRTVQRVRSAAEPSRRVRLARVGVNSNQEFALAQLRRMSALSNGAISMDKVEEIGDRATVILRLALGQLRHAPAGIEVGPAEAFLVSIGPDFPNAVPVVLVLHDRWNGTPHVEYHGQLCLYLAPSIEWVPADGMHGFVERLVTWLEHAATGTLDPPGALHPPVASPDFSAPRIVVKADAGEPSLRLIFGVLRGEHGRLEADRLERPAHSGRGPARRGGHSRPSASRHSRTPKPWAG